MSLTMKVLIITNDYPPSGNELYKTRCCAVVQALREQGHTVAVLTSDSELKHALPDGSQVQRTLKLSPAGESSAGMTQEDLWNCTAIEKALARLQPDVIHVWSLSGFSCNVLLHLQQLKLPVVYDVADTGLVDLLDSAGLRPWWQWPSRNARIAQHHSSLGLWPTFSRNFTAKRFAWPHVYFANDYTKNAMLERGHAVEHAPIIPCYYETPTHPQPKRNQELGARHVRRCPGEGGSLEQASGPIMTRLLPKDLQQGHGKSTKLMWVGDFSQQHDPMTAINAFKGLVSEGNKQATLHMYGTQAMEHVQPVIHALGLEARIQLSPLLTDQAHADYAQHDALIFTHTHAAATPTTVVHAMAAGLPVIAARNGSIPEMVKNDFNGLTFNTGDVEDLQQKIHTLLTMKDKGAILGRNGVDYVHRSLKKDAIIRQIEAYLLQAVALHVDYKV